MKKTSPPEKRISDCSMESGNTYIDSSEQDHQLLDDSDLKLHVRRLSITEKTDEDDTMMFDDSSSSIPGLLVPKSMEELRNIDDPMSTFDDGDDSNDVEMQKQKQLQAAQQEQAAQQSQSCLSLKSIVFAGAGLAVVFGAIYAIAKMRDNHNELFD